jgi:hypothetical protein
MIVERETKTINTIYIYPQRETKTINNCRNNDWKAMIDNKC